MKLKIYLACFLLLFGFSFKSLAKEVPNFRCEVRLSENNEDILSYWNVLHEAFRHNIYASFCFSEGQVTVDKSPMGYNFTLKQPEITFYEAFGFENVKLFSLKMNEGEIVIQTEKNQDEIFIKMQADKAIYELISSNSGETTIKASFLSEASYNEKQKIYRQANWQINGFQMDKTLYFSDGHMQTSIENIQGKLASFLTEDIEKRDVFHEVIFQNMHIQHQMAVIDIIEGVGTVEKDAVAKYMAEKIIWQQQYTQTDKEFWTAQNNCENKAYNMLMPICLYEKIKGKNIGTVEETIKAERLFLKTYSSENSLGEADIDEINFRLRLVEKDKKLSGSMYLKGQANHYAGERLEDILPLRPYDFSYHLGFVELSKNKINKAVNLGDINITQTPIFMNMQLKAQEDVALNLKAHALLVKESGFSLFSLISAFYDVGYDLNRLNSSQIEGELTVTHQSHLIKALAPMLPVRKNIANLFLGMYGKKVESNPPQHYYKFTIEEGNPKVNGKSLGLKF